jgi:hypothetical protein
MNQALAVSKFLKSFFRRDWSVRDYPLKVSQRPVDQLLVTKRFKELAWTAQIVNWWHMRGDGMSRDEALADLSGKLAVYKTSHRLPRPGTGAPLEVTWALSEAITQFEDVAYEIVERLFDIPREDCILTDESSLWDFHGEETNEPYLVALKQIFGVDASDLKPPTIAEIARRFQNVRLDSSGSQ